MTVYARAVPSKKEAREPTSYPRPRRVSLGRNATRDLGSTRTPRRRLFFLFLPFFFLFDGGFGSKRRFLRVAVRTSTRNGVLWYVMARRGLSWRVVVRHGASWCVMVRTSTRNQRVACGAIARFQRSQYLPRQAGRDEVMRAGGTKPINLGETVVRRTDALSFHNRTKHYEEYASIADFSDDIMR